MFKDDTTRLKHMLDSINDALSFAHGKERNDLDKNRMLSLSLVKCIEIIGEAANKVSNELKTKHNNLPWKDIVGMRNRLIHAYFDIDYDTLWGTISNELPSLAKEIENILEQEEK